MIFVREGIEIDEGNKDGKEPEPTVARSVAELLAVDDDAINRWAGKALVVRVGKLLVQGLPVEFEETEGFSARLPTRNVECRWMPGLGLEGMICSCHAATACEHRVAAVLAFQICAWHQGAGRAQQPWPGRRGRVAADQGRSSCLGGRGPCRDGGARALAAFARHGGTAAHAGRVGTWRRLTSARAALAGLATLTDSMLARDVQADSAAVLALASRADALRRGLARRPSFHLVGQHKTSYEPAGAIELVGLGARVWRSPSGYAGLTLYFWDRSARNWATWTDSRPLSVQGFDPVARYRGDGPWEGLASPEQASRETLRLTGAWRNRQGRLSGRPATRAWALGPSEPAQVPATIDRFDVLADRARLLFGGSFRDRTEQDEIVLLSPARWGLPVFDDLRQELVQVVNDAEGRPLPLVLRQSKENHEAITVLQNHDTSATSSVLGLLHLDAGRLFVEPIALHAGEEQINVTVDRALAASRSPETSPEVPGGEDEGEARCRRGHRAFRVEPGPVAGPAGDVAPGGWRGGRGRVQGDSRAAGPGPAPRGPRAHLL